jgi:hypothetical protein
MDALGPDVIRFLQQYPLLVPVLALLALLWRGLVFVWKSMPVIRQEFDQLVDFVTHVHGQWRRLRRTVRRRATIRCRCRRKMGSARKKERKTRRKQTRNVIGPQEAASL